MSQLLSQLSRTLVFPPTPVVEEDFSALNVEVFKDEFDRADPAPWVDAGGTGSVSIDDSKLVQTNTSGSVTIVRSQYSDPAPFTVGKWYKISGDWSGTNDGRLRVLDGAVLTFQSEAVSSGSVSLTFRAALTSYNIQVQADSLDALETGVWDNILIEEVPALDGWNNGPPATEVSVFSGELILTSTGTDNENAWYEFATEPGTNYLVGISYRKGDPADSAVYAYAQDWSTGSPTDTANFQLNDTTEMRRYFVSINGGDTHRVYVRFANIGIPIGDQGIYDDLTVVETILEDGTFDSGTAWTTGAGWTIASGVATHAPGTESDINQNTAYQFIDAQPYTVQYQITRYVAGTVQARLTNSSGLNAAVGAQNSGVGTYTETLVARSDTELALMLASSDFDGDIDNWVITQDGIGVRGDGTVTVVDGTAAPARFHNGLPFDDIAIDAKSGLAVDLTGTPDHYHQGLGFTAAGRIAAKTGTPAYFGSGAAPFQPFGILSFESAPQTAAVGGTPFTATSQVASKVVAAATGAFSDGFDEGYD